MKKIYPLIVFVLFAMNFTNAQCWFVDDSSDSVCLTDPADSCTPITYPDGTSARYIEALAIDPSGAPIYAADAGQVGILDPNTGLFTPFANPSGYADLDGLGWDAVTGKLYASARFVGANDSLICIQLTGPNAGQAIPGSQVEVTGSGNDIDELAFPPAACSNATVLYASMDSGGGVFVLSTIDPSTGIATQIGPFGIPDVESITFDADCNLYGNTGTGALYLVDQVTGAVIGDPIVNVNGTDVEGMSCTDSNPFGGSISNYIWVDTNGDGIQDANESGIEGIIINLLDDLGNPVLDPAGNPITASTDANGEYIFNNLPAGNYTVQIAPSNYTSGGALDGYAQTYDEDGSGDGEIDVVLDTNEDHVTADFGFQGTGSIGDLIWSDTNGDGIQDLDEDGIAGVTVTLYDDMGNVVGTTVTDLNGEYDFPNLPPGDYTVTVTPPAGYNNTGDPDGIFDNTSDVTLGPGENTDVVDYGYQGTGSIGDLIWSDTNGDGIQDAGEDGIAGVTVTLYDDLGNELATAVTDSNGNYNFPNLGAGDYIITVTPPAGYDNTGDPDGIFDNTTEVTLGSGEDIDVEDFGYQGTGSIGDLIWADTNGDGIQDPGETGIAGVTVTLYDNMGNVVGTEVTDANGAYDFTNLAPGFYTVTVTPPTGYNNTGDPDGIFDNTTDVNLLPGGDIDVEDFGYQGMSSISNFIWEDINGDGTQDLGEDGIAGVTVTLYDDLGNPILDAMGNPITSLTDANGEYMFDNLPPGDYMVEVDPSNFLAGGPLDGYEQTFDEDGGDDGEIGVGLGSNDDHNSADFGFRPIVLPIKLVEFNVALETNHARLVWSTAQEVNNDYFNIEYSFNGRDFNKIAEVKGQGNSDKLVSYDFLERNLDAGKHFFRLRQVDFDGNFSFSEIRSVNLKDATDETTVYPNPTADFIQVKTTMDFYTLYTVKGEVIFSGQNTGDKIDLTGLSKGMYILKLESNTESKSIRVMKL